MRLLLLSNSVAPGQGFLEHALGSVADAMGGGRRLLFFAHASFDPDGYTEVMQAALRQLDVEVVPAHRQGDLVHELDRADAVFVGGGNAFRLLKRFQDFGLLHVVQERVRGGLPYLGASAGTNLAYPTIRTTNDMPIVEPRSLVALGLVPFQINPHYVELDSAPFAARQRSHEFAEQSPSTLSLTPRATNGDVLFTADAESTDAPRTAFHRLTKLSVRVTNPWSSLSLIVSVSHAGFVS